ncbi:LemA family protein [Saccharicrinis aurantiacus]|uniref:LemA family protein n=1 Tax=Saccharicrinis aurantiacus TaxID=1849719 RepID=UPI002492BB1C|nr:LemA family protein [Saccharicrinis aurantiacus]
MIILVAIVSFILIILVTIYNNLIRRKNEVANAFGSVDVMLKKRYDLIPNLVEVTKEYMKHEKGVFAEITRLRTQVISEGSVTEDVTIHNNLQSKMNGLLMNVENYPQLKADSTFLALQANWTSSEEQISAARRYYNTAVTSYNNAIQVFPSNIIAGLLGFNEKKVFEAEEIERDNIKASDLFKA